MASKRDRGRALGIERQRDQENCGPHALVEELPRLGCHHINPARATRPRCLSRAGCAAITAPGYTVAQPARATVVVVDGTVVVVEEVAEGTVVVVEVVAEGTVVVGMAPGRREPVNRGGTGWANR